MQPAGDPADESPDTETETADADKPWRLPDILLSGLVRPVDLARAMGRQPVRSALAALGIGFVVWIALGWLIRSRGGVPPSTLPLRAVGSLTTLFVLLLIFAGGVGGVRALGGRGRIVRFLGTQFAAHGVVLGCFLPAVGLAGLFDDTVAWGLLVPAAVWLIAFQWTALRSAAELPASRAVIAMAGVGVVGASLLVVPAVFFGVFRVPSGAMLPTLQVGDTILVERTAYALRLPLMDAPVMRLDEPRRGDVVVYKRRGDEFVKRVVGTAGDRIAVDADGTVRIDGGAVPRCHVATHKAPSRDDPRSPQMTFDVFVEGIGRVCYVVRQIRLPPRDSARDSGRSGYRDLGGGRLIVTAASGDLPSRPYPRRRTPDAAEGSFVVPAGHVFVLGDNRDNSNDSRFSGPAAIDSVRGRVSAVISSSPGPNGWPPAGSRWIEDPPDLRGFPLTAEQIVCLRDLACGVGL